MKQYSIISIMVILLSFSCKSSTVQEITPPQPKATLEFPDAVQGTSLTYAYNEYGKITHVRLQLNALDDKIAFSYMVMNESNREGGFQMEKPVFETALSTNLDLINKHSIDLDQNGMLLSKKAYTHLTDNSLMEVDLGKGTKSYHFVQNEEIEIDFNDKRIYIPTIKFSDEDKVETYWVYKNLNFPIIVKSNPDLDMQLIKWEQPDSDV